MDCSTPGFPVHNQLLELVQTPGAQLPELAQTGQQQTLTKGLRICLAATKLFCQPVFVTSTIEFTQNLTSTLSIIRVSETNIQFGGTYEELCGFASVRLRQGTPSPNR